MSIIDKILNDVCARPSIPDGTFRADNPSHVDALREYLMEKGIPKEVVYEGCNHLMDGKHPERQAYNKDGLLITFPTPKHKQDAVTAGTHFEKDPTKASPNIFTAPGAQPAPPVAQPAAADVSAPAAGQSAAPLAPPAPAPAAPPDPASQSAPQTPQERVATATVIQQILKSDDSILQEISLWLEENMPVRFKGKFIK